MPVTDASALGRADAWAARQAVLLETIARHDREMARHAGLQAVAMAALAREAAMYAGPDETDFERGQRSVHVQAALTLTSAERTATARVEVAERLASRLPKTLKALCAGLITLPKARAILEETINLSVEQCLQLEDGILLTRAQKLTPGNLRRAARKLVIKMDKDAAKKRAQKAREERGVSIWSNEDGTHILHAVLPSEDAIAVFGVIDTFAQANRKTLEPDDERGIGALRADALVDLITRPNGEQRIQHQIGVVAPAGTLLGLGEEDGYMPGYGPIPAALCRELAADNTWRRILTDPDTGHLLDLSAERYRPSDRLAAFIRTRDQHCRFPACRGKACDCDIDHSLEFTIGGRSIRINLGGLCEHHHTVRHLPGWDLIQDPDGSGTMTFLTPTGQMYRTRPPNLLTGEDPETDIPAPRWPPIPDEPPF